jgi:hypothetical protein
MAIGEVVINGDLRIVAQIGEIPDAVRKALIDGFTPVAASVRESAKARAAAHIRYLGMNPGVYVDKITSGVTQKPQRILGYVRSAKPTVHFKGRDVPLAVLMEYGATIPAHEILPSMAHALKFGGDVSAVLRKAVHHPGAKIPAYPAIRPALDEARGAIMDVLESVKIKCSLEKRSRP